jgi:hypothetical protein
VRVSAGLAGVAAAFLVTGLATIPVAQSGTARAADAAPPSTLYVLINGAGCSSNGPGTQAEPFCSIQEAANVVQPGQTVEVRAGENGVVGEPVTISSKGTQAEPITFVYEETPDQAILTTTQASPASQPVIKFNGAQYVTFSSFDIRSGGSGDGIDVDESSNITLENLSVTTYAHSTGISIDGSSSDVTVEHAKTYGVQAHGVLAQAGASGVVLTTNSVSAPGGSGITLDGVAQSVVTSNTVIASCPASGTGTAITLEDGSSATVQNNVIEAESNTSCVAPAAGLLVDAASAGGVTTGYNAFFTEGGANYYSWAGTAYSTVQAFQQAVPGQGTNDLDLSAVVSTVPPEGSPAIDSASCSAPGELSTDILGNPRVSDPLATDANLGNGTCHADRGAYERQDTLSALTDTASPAANQAGYRVQSVSAPFGVTISAAVTSSWGEAIAYTVNFGDGSTPATATVGTAATHAYARAGQYTVTITAADTSGSSEQATVSFDVMSATPPAVTLTAQPRGIIGQIEADTADFTYSAGRLGWEVASASIADGDGASQPVTPSGPGAFIYAKPGTYTATVTVTDLLGRTSTAKDTVTVGDEMQPVYPRTGYNHVVAAHGTVTMSPASLDGDCCSRAALVNVTVTSPKKTGSIVVYPEGTSRPDRATVQFQAGQAAENSALATFGRGGVEFYNNSDGTLDLNVTTYGLEEGTISQANAVISPTYHPVTPALVLSRTELAPEHKTVVGLVGRDGIPANVDDVFLEITESGSAAAGAMSAYGEREGTISEVAVRSWAKGQQVTGLATVLVNGDRAILVNDSKGNAYFTAEVVGYDYFPPPYAGEVFTPSTDGSVFLPATPDRLLAVKLAGRHWVKLAIAGRDGVPASGTTAAMVNLTASGSSASGSLTAYADGTTRPSSLISLSFAREQAVANQAIVQVGADGAIDVYNAGSAPVNLTVDLSGSYHAYLAGS